MKPKFALPIGRVCVVLLAALLMVGAAARSEAQFYKMIKTVTWDVTNKDGTGPREEGALTKARLFMHVFAGDKHKTVHKDHPEANGEGLVPRPLATAVEGAKYKGNVTLQAHAKWRAVTSTPGTYLLGGSPDPLSAVTPHADSESAAEYFVGDPVKAGDRYLVTGTMRVEGSGLTSQMPKAHGPETAYADSAAGVELTLVGGTIKSSEIDNGKVKIKGAGIGLSSVGVHGFAGERETREPLLPTFNPASVAQDPMYVSIFDETTGLLLGKQMIFEDLFQTEGDAAIDWTPGFGLDLSVVPGATALMQISMPGSWVLNPINGSAFLDEAGGFTTTGDLTSLPWDVSTLAGRTTASLSPGALPSMFTFDIEADGILNNGHDVYAVLDTDANGFGRDYNTVDTAVPEASSLALLAAGLAGLGVAAVRKRRRG